MSDRRYISPWSPGSVSVIRSVRPFVFVAHSFRPVPETNGTRTIISIVFAVPARLLNAPPAYGQMSRRTNESRPPPDRDLANSPPRQPNRGYCPPTTPPPPQTDRYRSRYIVTTGLLIVTHRVIVRPLQWGRAQDDRNFSASFSPQLPPPAVGPQVLGTRVGVARRQRFWGFRMGAKRRPSLDLE